MQSSQNRQTFNKLFEMECELKVGQNLLVQTIHLYVTRFISYFATAKCAVENNNGEIVHVFLSHWPMHWPHLNFSIIYLPSSSSLSPSLVHALDFTGCFFLNTLSSLIENKSSVLQLLV